MPKKKSRKKVLQHKLWSPLHYNTVSVRVSVNCEVRYPITLTLTRVGLTGMQRVSTPLFGVGKSHRTLRAQTQRLAGTAYTRLRGGRVV